MEDHSWNNKYNLLIFDKIDSSNNEAKRLCHTGISDNFLIWAKSQTKGRGRYGRNWSSPQGNLYFSILIKPVFDAKKATELSFLTAISVGETIKTFSNKCKLEYKWPNDIILNGKKLGGILIESSTSINEKKLDWLVIGIGINVISYPDKKVSYNATSLLNENINVECGTILDKFMINFIKNYNIWEKKGFHLIRRIWLENAMNLNKVLTVNLGQNRISGIFKNISDNGDLELSLASGEICQISTGEVLNNNY